MRQRLVYFIDKHFFTMLWVVAAILLFVTLSLFYIGFKNNVAWKAIYPWIALTSGSLGFVLATIGWVWTGRLNLAMQRKTNALALLARTYEPSVLSQKKKVYKYIKDYEEYRHPHGNKQVERPVMPRHTVEKLLGIYEQVSVGVLLGAADEEIVRESQCLVFKRIYIGLKTHIDYIQAENPRYYEHFEKLTCRWFNELSPKPATVKDVSLLFDPLKAASQSN